MAYVLLKTMRYNTETTKTYIHKVVDELVTVLGQVGVTATGKKFDSSTNLTNSGTLTTNNMPSWVETLAGTNVTWKVERFYGSKYNAGSKCYGCVYWEVDGIKYAYFMGAGYSSSITDYIADTLVQSMYVDGATDTEQKLTIACGHDNYSSTYSYFGYKNIPDRFSIARTSTGFHFYLKGYDTTSYNFYAGHVATSYGDSLLNPLWATMTKVPLHNNMIKTVHARSFGCECYSMINRSEGDIPTGKYYMFDVFYGISSGTIIGTANETKCIPYLPSALGEVANVGGDIYLRIGDVNHSYSSSYNQPMMVKVN